MQDPKDPIPQASRREPWNKGKLTEARLVDPDQAANRGANTRPGHVQSSHR